MGRIRWVAAGLVVVLLACSPRLGKREAGTALVLSTQPSSPPVPALPVIRAGVEPRVLGTARFRHEASIRTVAFSANGERLASLARDGFIHVWDSASGKLIRRFQAWVERIALSADGRLLAAGCAPQGAARDRCRVLVWNTATGKVVQDRSVAHRQVEALTFCRQSTRLAASLRYGSVLVWDVGDPEPPRELRPPDDSDDPPSLACSPDGTTLAVGTSSAVELWDLAQGKLMRKLPGGPVVQFLPQRGLLAVQVRQADEDAGFDWYGLDLWDWRASRIVGSVSDESWDHSQFVFDPDLRWVTLAQADGGHFGAPDPVRVLEWPSGVSLASLAAAESIAAPGDGSRLATINSGNAVRIWALPSGTPVLTDSHHETAIQRAFFVAGGGAITSAGPVHHWDTRSGQRLGRIEGVGPVSVSPNGRIAVGCRHESRSESKLQLFNATTREPTWQTSARCQDLAVADSSLIVASTGCRIFAYDPRGSGAAQPQFTDGCESRVSALWIAPDGGRLAALLANGPKHGRLSFGERPEEWHATGRYRLLLRHVAQDDARLVSLPSEHPGRTKAWAFSRDGRWVALGDADGSIRLRDTASGRVTLELAGHTKSVTALAFARDGAALFSGAEDGTLRVWDASSGAEIQSSFAPSVVTTIDVSPHAALLLTGHRDTTARLWELVPVSSAGRGPIPRPLSRRLRCRDGESTPPS